MANVSDPAIVEAYEAVRNDKESLNWLLLDYEDKGDVIKLSQKGDGGLDELKSHLKPKSASFGYARVDFSNDEESKRVKFILIIWIGENVKVMRKAKVSVHAADVKSVLRQYSIEVPISDTDDLDEKDIIIRLRKAGGASYDGV